MNFRKKMKVKKILLFPAIILLFSANIASQEAGAQEAVRLTPEEAVELALRNNLSLESTRIGLETSRRASDLSWNQFIPSVTVAGAFSRENSASSVSGTAFLDPNNIDPSTGRPGPITDPVLLGSPVPIPGFGSSVIIAPYSANGPQIAFAIPINVSLTLSLAMLENMNRLRLDYENGLISYEKAKLQLERDIRKAYHNMLLLQENIELLRGSFENMNRQVQMAQANFNAGLAPELTLIQARVARENMRPVIDQAENGLRLSMAQFAMFLGMEYETQFELISVSDNLNFIEVDTTEMIRRAASEKPEIQELRRSIQMLESARKIQWNSLYPALTISWGMTPTFLGDPMNDWRSPTPGSLSISLGIRLHSLIPFSPDFQAVRALDDQIRAANIGLTQMINGAELEVYNLVLELERIRLSAQAQAENVDLAERSFRLTEQAYRAGLQDYFQVQSAQQALHQARVQMLEQQFSYLNNLLDLEYAIGVPFGTLSN